MKRFTLLLAFIIALSPACLADASSADESPADPSHAWNAFPDMTGEAGQDADTWSVEDGAADWDDDVPDNIPNWGTESGATGWSGNASVDVSEWIEESGAVEWSAEAARNIQAFADDNRPALEAWLSAADDEITRAWSILMNANQYSDEEVDEAYRIISEAFGDVDIDREELEDLDESDIPEDE